MAERKSKGVEAARARTRLKQRVHNLYLHENMKIIDIAVETGLSPSSVSKYIRETGAYSKRAKGSAVSVDVGIVEPLEKFLDAASKGEVTTRDEATATPEEISYARKEENESISAIANDNMTAADRYQSYLAGQGMRMIRDSLPHLRKPTNVKELEILDTIVRRNLGIGNGKNGGSSRMRIDVNILNNSKASPKGAIVDVVEDD
jgi:predicted transcriptional regulator